MRKKTTNKENRETKEEKSDIFFYTSTEMYKLPAESIIYIMADGNYSYIYLVNNTVLTIVLQLGKIAEMIVNSNDNKPYRFLRIGRKYIVNCDYITYIHPSHQELILADFHNFNVKLEVSQGALKEVKELFEKEAQNEK